MGQTETCVLLFDVRTKKMCNFCTFRCTHTNTLSTKSIKYNNILMVSFRISFSVIYASVQNY